MLRRLLLIPCIAVVGCSTNPIIYNGKEKVEMRVSCYTEFTIYQKDQGYIGVGDSGKVEIVNPDKGSEVIICYTDELVRDSLYHHNYLYLEANTDTTINIQ